MLLTTGISGAIRPVSTVDAGDTSDSFGFGGTSDNGFGGTSDDSTYGRRTDGLNVRTYDGRQPAVQLYSADSAAGGNNVVRVRTTGAAAGAGSSP